jgi:hypothetical protein
VPLATCNLHFTSPPYHIAKDSLPYRLTALPNYTLPQAIEFTQRLSVYMVKHNKTKLPQRTTSTLFTSKLDVDVFFSDAPLEKAVRKIAPIRTSDGFLAFIHNTIMEHSVATAVARGLAAAVEASGLTPQDIIKVSAHVGSTWVLALGMWSNVVWLNFKGRHMQLKGGKQSLTLHIRRMPTQSGGVQNTRV